MRQLKPIIVLVLVVLAAVWWQGRTGTPASIPPAPTISANAAEDLHANALPGEVRSTLLRIARGGPFTHRQDGGVFGNYEGLLPSSARGFYHEYTVETPGAGNRGARRIITGGTPPERLLLHRRSLPQLSSHPG